ncbi:MAG: FAD-dependent oxidoreductase [Candidatus Limnocylindrales bacterium]
MADRFRPISMEQLTDWVFDELEQQDALFGIPRSAFFVPHEADPFRLRAYGQTLETPFGVAAGPHTQMAQNIIVSWLVGARFIELKTVQTLDELDVNKPCIDLQDEGYNVEWSQELKVFESFDEYLRAWVLIHALHRRLGFPGERPGLVFNMSVGYNLEGIQKPNVQWYLDAMADASAYLPAYIDIVARRSPEVRDIGVPERISDTITLSTMHGCPPDEIERISLYLLEERRLHTSVKCNPTLLGAERVRAIINHDLAFADVPVPDAAFGHDLRYVDAVPMFHNLRRVAAAQDRTFGLKLSNTLEVENWRTRFDRDEMMYLSGRALHPVTVNLAARLREEFRGDLPISFAGGADCFNVSELLATGMTTVTVCSDLLKTGGYLRMLQYTEQLRARMEALEAGDLDDLIARTAIGSEGFGEFASLLHWSALTDSGLALELEDCHSLAGSLSAADGPAADRVARWASERELDAGQADALAELVLATLARVNLRRYAAATRGDWRYQKGSFRTDHSKTTRALGLFDCIEAPCIDECPVDQKVPQYMDAVRRGDLAAAVRFARQDNPLPSILGQVCDHLCENTCIRTHLDQPLAIRQVKRFIMEQEQQPIQLRPRQPSGTRVAIIGAGPAGLSAALVLAQAGHPVTVFEAHAYPGGMVGGAIPAYRLPQPKIDQDVAVLTALGVEMRYGRTAGVDFTLDSLRADGFEAIFVAVGAQLAKRLGLAGEEADGVMDALRFLRSVREGDPLPIGARVGVIGAGDTAMDAVRSALRTGAREASLIYRRTVDQMPADPEELHACREEGVRIVELARPHALHVEDGRLVGLICTRTQYRGDRDAAGRKVPHDVPGSEFEIPLDSLILAISQHSVLDFFGDEQPALTAGGYIDVDPFTFETSIRGIYAGGDVSGTGPSSIVKAAAEGKAVAAAIMAAHGEASDAAVASADRANADRASTGAGEVGRVDLADMVVRRARRDYRVPIEVTPLDARDGFEQTVVGYTAEQAMTEAARCLDCHRICSLCVGVCPNMALMTYQSQPFRAALPELRVLAGQDLSGERHAYRAEQALQIAVLTDFCNECGNCTTACPTSGEPYRDKPRLYLDGADFADQQDNAFRLLHDGSIEARWQGETHRLRVDGSVEYSTPAFTARLDTETFGLLDATVSPSCVEGQSLPLEPAAAMYVLLSGLRSSMAHLPTADRGAASGTRVSHPGYAE